MDARFLGEEWRRSEGGASSFLLPLYPKKAGAQGRGDDDAAAAAGNTTAVLPATGSNAFPNGCVQTIDAEILLLFFFGLILYDKLVSWIGAKGMMSGKDFYHVVVQPGYE